MLHFIKFLLQLCNVSNVIVASTYKRVFNYISNKNSICNKIQIWYFFRRIL